MLSAPAVLRGSPATRPAPTPAVLRASPRARTWRLVRAAGEGEGGEGSGRTPPPPLPQPGSSSAEQGTASSGSSATLAIAAVGAGAALFAATRLLGGAPTLAALQADSVPLNEALRNSRPTLVEFYANWCETCREMVPDTLAVEQRYAEDVNFVMLNIDNPKWAEEVGRFRVTGIPEYVFLDAQGGEKAIAVGRVPRSVLEQDVQALAERREELPFAAVKRESSAVPPPGSASRGAPSPRDHA
eukprot:jgi/Tetstr1/424810/TSEL_015313.t1